VGEAVTLAPGAKIWEMSSPAFDVQIDFAGRTGEKSYQFMKYLNGMVSPVEGVPITVYLDSPGQTVEIGGVEGGGLEGSLGPNGGTPIFTVQKLPGEIDVCLKAPK
jgi:hypothetical protein